MRGFAVAPIMVLGVVCLLLAFTLAEIATWQLQAATRADHSEKALYLAEGAIGQTMSRLHAGLAPGATAFGRSHETVVFAPSPGDTGTVSFDPATPWGYSTNDYDGTQGNGFGGTPVPPGMVHVIARGVSRDVIRTIEAFIAIPKYTYVLSVAGPLQTTDPLRVRAETSMDAFVSNLQNGTPDMHSGANIGSDTSIAAGAGSLVTGDVVCSDAANISLAAPSTVGGVVRQGFVSLPDIKVTAFNTSGPTVPVLPAANANGVVEAVQNTYTQGSPDVVVNGTLQLDGTTAYVEGNLHVTGGVQGTGALIVHGNVTIDSGADLASENLVALISAGDVSMNGNAKYFQGLVYAGGAFTTSNITIAGAFAAAPGPDSTADDSRLWLGPNTQVVYVPAATTITNASAAIAALAPAWMNPGSVVSPVQTMPPGPWTPAVLDQRNAPNATLYNILKSAFGGDALFNPYSMPPNGLYVDGALVPSNKPPMMDNIGVITMQYDPASNQFVPVVPPQYSFVEEPSAGVAMGVSQAQIDADIAYTGFTSAQFIAHITQVEQLYMVEANKLLQRPFVAGSPQPSVPNLTLDNFLSDPSPLHVVSWRER